MARIKDTEKRNRILTSAKALFAERGFAGTSISDIATATDVPVGSIYTYFENKEALLQAIVEEGWAQFYTRLVELTESDIDAAGKLRVVVNEFLPMLIKDVDLINILLSEGITTTRLQEKLERLAALVSEMTAPLFARSATAPRLDQTEFQAALMVYFLGVLHSARISRTADLTVTIDDIVNFLRSSIEHALEIRV